MSISPSPITIALTRSYLGGGSVMTRMTAAPDPAFTTLPDSSSLSTGTLLILTEKIADGQSSTGPSTGRVNVVALTIGLSITFIMLVVLGLLVFVWRRRSIARRKDRMDHIAARVGRAMMATGTAGAVSSIEEKNVGIAVDLKIEALS
ncbi:hypothetical protein FA15DRAFT_672497 [Coprinopsis marcescibilis]|uniref:Uncharacterized protein n=1 Tax=Coprinopsis marcescibilis TaxID=230819 RepID=A0A5C3KN31_COPMA|nr:hypothetical protein FA15DRAFT_672497 [Coprinopsis marcescibilis]